MTRSHPFKNHSFIEIEKGSTGEVEKYWYADYFIESNDIVVYRVLSKDPVMLETLKRYSMKDFRVKRIVWLAKGEE